MTVCLEEQPARSQARLSKADFHRWQSPDGSAWAQFYRVDGAYLVRFPGLADFQISKDGGEVISRHVPGVPRSTLQHLFLNMVVPLSLSRQGKLVLHAAAVEIQSGAVALVGPAGRGKSTLTASFAGAGHRFLSDDGVQVDMEATGRTWIYPSHPSIRLWADSEQFLASGLPKGDPLAFTSKARVLAGDALKHCAEPCVLRHVYFLGDQNVKRPDIAPMSAGSAMIELVKNSYLLDIEARELLENQFNSLSSLAALPIFSSLDYPRVFEKLPETRNAILEHFSSVRYES
jgi:hypothetical protein